MIPFSPHNKPHLKMPTASRTIKNANYDKILEIMNLNFLASSQKLIELHFLLFYDFNIKLPNEQSTRYTCLS